MSSTTSTGKRAAIASAVPAAPRPAPTGSASSVEFPAADGARLRARRFAAPVGSTLTILLLPGVLTEAKEYDLLASRLRDGPALPSARTTDGPDSPITRTESAPDVGSEEAALMTVHVRRLIAIVGSEDRTFQVDRFPGVVGLHRNGSTEIVDRIDRDGLITSDEAAPIPVRWLAALSR